MKVSLEVDLRGGERENLSFIQHILFEIPSMPKIYVVNSFYDEIMFKNPTLD
jgi:hypothetical protein